MVNKFLKAKHWQLFLLVFGIPMLFQFIIMGSMISSLSSGNEPSIDMMFNYFKLFPLMMILTMFVFFGWFWSIAIGLDQKIPDHLKLNIGRFKLLQIIPIIYMILFCIFMSIMITGIMNSTSAPNLTFLGIIVPFHLFSMFCIFYCLHFVAKTIKIAETQEPVTFSDFAGEFFLIWFFPIGIWIIQPRINKLMEELD